MGITERVAFSCFHFQEGDCGNNSRARALRNLYGYQRKVGKSAQRLSDSILRYSQTCRDVALGKIGYLLSRVSAMPAEDGIDGHTIGANLTGVLVDDFVIDKEPTRLSLVPHGDIG